MPSRKFKPNTGFKMTSPLAKKGIFTNYGTEKQKRISSEEAKTAKGVTRTGDDISMDVYKREGFSKKQLDRIRPEVKREREYSIKQMKKKGTYKKDKEDQARIEAKSKKNKKKSATKKKSPYRAGQTAGQIIRRERHMV